MSLIILRRVSLAFGDAPLLENVDLSIKRGERIALVGRNGAGKSTLMRVLLGELLPDSGEREVSDTLRAAWLDQHVPEQLEGSVFDVVAGGLGDTGRLLADYEHLVERAAEDESLLDSLFALQAQLDSQGSWSLQQRVQATLSRLELDGTALFGALSGGLKRRVWLARALVSDPDLLLLDEPTNHLDIDAIEWLEEFLLGFPGAVVFVTHDRRFLQRLATRILDLERGRLTDFPGDWSRYLERKQAALDAEERASREFDKRLSEEEVWIRQGVKARRTRNEGRVRALQAMRRERAERRARMGRSRLEANLGVASGKRVIETSGIHYAVGERTLIHDFSCLIERGDKIGIIGPNGVGKTTLLRILLGELTPDRGTVTHGTRLQIAYFDQLRAQLDLEKSVRDNVADGADYIEIGGQRKHVMGYLADFLFTPERARSPVKVLSGGERNRLLLARLFTQPANLLVMDEPTNDLDAETLELLEERVSEFEGTLLLVSHDRVFLDNVVTGLLAFEGEGRVAEYVGGYEDWVRQRPTVQPATAMAKAAPAAPAAPATKPIRSARVRLSYKDQRELEALPQRIESLEAEQALLAEQMSSPDFFRQPTEAVVAAQQRLTEVEQEVQAAYSRWEELESAST